MPMPSPPPTGFPPRRIALAATVVLAAGLLTSCQSAQPDAARPAVAAKKTTAATTADPSVTKLPSRGKVLARAEGREDLVAEIYQVSRTDGILTVRARLTNTGERTWTGAVDWENETPEGTVSYTLGGSSITDAADRKRYLALMDSNSKCLCSESINTIQAGESALVFAQFDVPKSPKVSLQLADMNPVDIPVPAEEPS